MPPNLSTILNINLKGCKLTAILLLSPLFFHAQTLTGLWTGALSNDSNTVRKDQSFEIALTEYRGKVYGYSRSEFIVDDILYYIVKRVSGTISGDVCEVIDDEIISFNFPKLLDKKIKVTSTFRRNRNDSSWYLDGTWKTNATKKYYSVTGKVNLEEEKDLTASKIFPHLEELKLDADVAFYKDRKEGTPIVKIAKPEKIKPAYAAKADQLSLNTDVAVTTNKPILQRAEASPIPAATTVAGPGQTTIDIADIEIKDEDLPALKKPETTLPKTETKNIPTNTVAITPSVTTKTIAQNKKIETAATPDKSTAAITSNNVAENKQVATEQVAKTIARQDPPVIKTQTVATTKQPDTKSVAKTTTPPATSNAVKTTPETKKQDIALIAVPKTTQAPAVNTVSEKKQIIAAPLTATATPEIKKPEVDITIKAATISGRKSEFTQVVNFKSDSLQLSLYDNGEIDGDTVSVFMNGEVLMAKQGLKASAIKKTIYITSGNEDFTLVLFAENLGKYPPNTGLLVVRDGDDVYNLRFSSDFQKNAGIVFKRKK